MTMRWGLGPVFACESVLGARRWQVYASRSGFVLVLLAGMAFVWVVYLPGVSARKIGPRPGSYQQMAAIGEGFFYALTSIQISLILLAAPAAAAGSLGVDRARGTLLQMMVTDLSDAEIILGTLAARLAPVVSLVVCAVPVTALAALLGGIDSGALAGALTVSLSVALLGCVLALTFSVWVTKLHEVLMAVYILEALWLIAAPTWAGLTPWVVMGPPTWFWKANPYVLAFAPYKLPGYAGATDFAAFTGGVLTFSAVLLGLAVMRLRPVVVEQSGRQVRAVGQGGQRVLRFIFPSWAGPSLEGNPVLWREWHRNRPSRLTRVIEATLLISAWAIAAYGTYLSVTDGEDVGVGTLQGSLAIFLGFGLLMISATGPTTLAEERTRGSLDVLLATPLSTRDIVVAKWWGVYRRVVLMLPLFLYVAMFAAATAPDSRATTAGMRFSPPLMPLTYLDRLFAATYCPLDFLASGALLVSVGVAMATWVRRLGRAVALSVISFFLIGLVWPMVVEISFSLILRRLMQGVAAPQWYSENRWLVNTLASFSPIYGTAHILQLLHWNQFGAKMWGGLAVVIVVKAAVAWLLLGLSIRTFDRCLGRLPEAPRGGRGDKPIVVGELS